MRCKKNAIIGLDISMANRLTIQKSTVALGFTLFPDIKTHNPILRSPLSYVSGVKSQNKIARNTLLVCVIMPIRY